MDEEEFRGRIRVFRLPDARMSSPAEHVRCARYWDEQFRELDPVVRDGGTHGLGEADFQGYKLMRDFAHRVGDMLATIADTLHPKDFEELKTRGFEDWASK